MMGGRWVFWFLVTVDILFIDLEDGYKVVYFITVY